MKLYFSSSSPFVRKVMVSAHELGFADQIERIPAAPHPVKRDLSICGANPLAQIPTLVTGEGDSIFDSRVICEYLDAKAQGDLFGSGPTRWRNLTQAAMGDGLLERRTPKQNR
jgi:glutathione S-transferase